MDSIPLAGSTFSSKTFIDSLHLHRAIVFSCVRLYYIHVMETSTDPDINYSLTITYSAIEVNLAIWAASIPALWPLIRGRVSRHSNRNSDYYSPREGHHRTGSWWFQTTCRGHQTESRDGIADLELRDMGRSRINTMNCRDYPSGGSEEDILGPYVDRSPSRRLNVSTAAKTMV